MGRRPEGGGNRSGWKTGARLPRARARTNACARIRTGSPISSENETRACPRFPSRTGPSCVRVSAFLNRRRDILEITRAPPFLVPSGSVVPLSRTGIECPSRRFVLSRGGSSRASAQQPRRPIVVTIHVRALARACTVPIVLRVRFVGAPAFLF